MTIRTAAGNSDPPWKRTFLPLPRCASRATFFADEDDDGDGATRAGAYLGVLRNGGRRVAGARSRASAAYASATARGDAAPVTHSRPAAPIRSSAPRSATILASAVVN